MMRIARTGTAMLLMGGGMALTACTTPTTITVTTTADTVADDGVTSLREAFARASTDAVDNTIVLAEHTYILNHCAGGALEHTASSRLTIDGNQATIRQVCDHTAIVASTHPASTLVIDEATLVGGPNSGLPMAGAAITVRGALMLGSDSTVTGVNSGLGGSVVEATGPSAGAVTLRGRIVDNAGAAIWAHDGDVVLDHGTIARNVGEGVRLDGASTLTAERATIDANTGHGVYVRGDGKARIEANDTTISGNFGGVECYGCGDLTFTGSLVTWNGNVEPGGGGGITSLVHQDEPDDAPRVEITDTTVSYNRSGYPGGGLYLATIVSTAPTAPDPEVVLTDSSVIGNSTAQAYGVGGGVAVSNSDLTVVRTRINNNSTEWYRLGEGGGLYFASNDDLSTDSHDFRADRMELGSNSAEGSWGGGGYIQTGGRVEVVRGSVTDNSADQGAGLYLAAESEISNSFIVGNTAVGPGGGLHLRGGSVTNSLFQRNAASEGGGAFFGGTGTGADLSVDSSTFAGNMASVRGGGIAADGTRMVEVANSTITGNAAPSGGGMAVGDDPALPVSLVHVTLAGNRAASGANVAALTGPLRLFASLVVAPLGGGANCAVDPLDRDPQGYSFLSDSTCGVAATDIVSTADPQLGPLAHNAGDTPTRLPATGSPIGGTVPVATCTIGVDQRSVDRPLGAACEPGSVEITETETDIADTADAADTRGA